MGLPAYLFHYVEHEGEQGHAHEDAVVGLAKDGKIGVLVQVLVEFVGFGSRIPGQGMHDNGIGLAVAGCKSPG